MTYEYVMGGFQEIGRWGYIEVAIKSTLVHTHLPAELKVVSCCSWWSCTLKSYYMATVLFRYQDWYKVGANACWSLSFAIQGNKETSKCKWSQFLWAHSQLSFKGGSFRLHTELVCDALFCSLGHRYVTSYFVHELTSSYRHVYTSQYIQFLHGIMSFNPLSQLKINPLNVIFDSMAKTDA